MKAKLYWDRANQEGRDSEIFPLLITLFCELLVRGVLTKKHPTLNAAVDENSVVFGAGLIPARPAKSIDFQTALNRLRLLMADIPEEEIAYINLLGSHRNEELHGDTVGFSELVADDMLPKVFSFAIRLIDFCGEDAEKILGKESAGQARQVFEAVQKDRSKRVRGLITAHKERFYSQTQEQKEQAWSDGKVSFVSAVMTNGHHMKAFKCPACGCMSTLVGVPVSTSAPKLVDDEILQEVRVTPSAFSCKACGLAINGLDELLSAGFPHEFRSLSSLDPVEHLSIDPMEYVDVDEIVREYHHYEPEYMDE